MKFVDKTESYGPIVEIGKEGSFENSDGAVVGYHFSPSDVKLTIVGLYFSSLGIDELISFLEFAKTKLKK